MGHWVTLEDDQHVYISDGGKVLATRSAISSAGGGKERGKALAARSKAAIGKARAIQHAKTEAVAHNKAKGRGTPERAALAKYYREDRANTVAAKAALAKATASTRNPVTTQGVELTGKPGNAPHVAASKFKVPTELKVPEKVRAAALAKSNTEMREQARAAGWGKSKPKPKTTPERAAGPSADTIDRQFNLHQKQGWGSYKDVGEERKDAAIHARTVHAKAVENIAKWKKEGAPAGTKEALAKARDQAEKALAQAKALGALKGARAKHYATLKAVKLMQRSIQR